MDSSLRATLSTSFCRKMQSLSRVHRPQGSLRGHRSPGSSQEKSPSLRVYILPLERPRLSGDSTACAEAPGGFGDAAMPSPHPDGLGMTIGSTRAGTWGTGTVSPCNGCI